MSKRLVVMQPTYLPYAGYFRLIDSSDVFVFLDDVQFSNQSWQQRNRIFNGRDVQWLTVPIMHNNGQMICDVRIDNSSNWKYKHLRTIETVYQRCPFFKDFFPYIRSVINDDVCFISDLNIRLISLICSFLGVGSNFKISSKLGVVGDRVMRLVNLCKMFGCDTYVSTMGSRDYLDVGVFMENGVGVEFLEFEPGFSVIDVLFNKGVLN